MPRQELVHPVTDHFVLVPQMAEIHAKDAAIVIHEPERVEAEPWHAKQGACRSNPSPAAYCSCQAEGREPEPARVPLPSPAPYGAGSPEMTRFACHSAAG
jgi:hypothetical protein